MNPSRSKDFRAAYVNKVGLQAHQVRTPLETVLGGDIIDIPKLRDICTRTGIPSQYRPLVWKLLLGVLPPCKSVWKFVQVENNERYAQLVSAMPILLSADEDSPLDYSRLHVDCRPYENTATQFIRLLRTQRCIHRSCAIPQAEPLPDSSLQAAAIIFASVLELEAEAYLCFAAFVEREEKAGPFVDPDLITLLALEDEALARHLVSLNTNIGSFGGPWLRSYFAETVPISALERLWDRLVALRAASFVACMAVALLTAVKPKLHGFKTAEHAVTFLLWLPEVNVDTALRRATETHARLVEEMALSAPTADLRMRRSRSTSLVSPSRAALNSPTARAQEHLPPPFSFA